MGIVRFFSLARLAQLCSFLVEEGHRSHAPQSSQLSTSPARDPMLLGCTIYTVPQSAVPVLVPLHFAARISLLGLQQVASIHAFRLHDTRGS